MGISVDRQPFDWQCGDHGAAVRWVAAGADRCDASLVDDGPVAAQGVGRRVRLVRDPRPVALALRLRDVSDVDLD